jgi:hypothetical protein
MPDQGSAGGRLAVVASVLVYAYLLERVRFAHTVRTFGGAHEPWWFGYARDAVTLVGAGLFVFSYRTLGLADPPALIVGALAALLEWGVHEALGERMQVRRAAAWTVLATVTALLPSLLFPAQLAVRLDRVLAALFQAR